MNKLSPKSSKKLVSEMATEDNEEMVMPFDYSKFSEPEEFLPHFQVIILILFIFK